MKLSKDSRKTTKPHSYYCLGSRNIMKAIFLGSEHRLKTLRHEVYWRSCPIPECFTQRKKYHWFHIYSHFLGILMQTPPLILMCCDLSLTHEQEPWRHMVCCCSGTSEEDFLKSTKDINNHPTTYTVITLLLAMICLPGHDLLEPLRKMSN